jgi:hypothetical protein
MDGRDEHTDDVKRGTRPSPEPDQDLRVCVVCSSDLVYPVEWEECASENWRVLLRCPNCEVRRDGIFSQRTVDAFDAALDDGTEVLARAHISVTRSNMAEELERFVAALDADAILPEDF